MSPKSNKIIEPPGNLENDNQVIDKKDNVVGGAIKEVLGGDLISTGTFKFFRYLLYLALLAFIYIANNYYAENNIREINKLRKGLKELRYEYINVKTRLMHIEKQSQIAKKLEIKGIKKNTQPVKILKIK
jgi:cell division protein FtsL